MSSALAVCPFCNAPLAALATVPTAPRLACPRCGEPVPSDRFPLDESVVRSAPIPPEDRATVKGGTARIVFAIMAGMAVIALVFALMTRQTRRDRDPRLPVATPDYLAPPAQLLALGYLPRGTSVVACMQLAAMDHDGTGKALLNSPRPEPVTQMLAVLDLVGLSPDDIDHLMFGCDLATLPRYTTVIVTRSPYDLAKVTHAAGRQPVSAAQFRDRPLYRFTGRSGVPKLWCASPRVLVYTTLTREEMDRIPGEAGGASDPLTATVRKALIERLSKQSRIWAVGDLEAAKGLADLLPFVGVPKEPARIVSLVRAFAIGITTQQGDQVTLLGNFQTGDAGATQELKNSLMGVTIPGTKAQRVEAPPADIHAPEAQWVSWQIRCDAGMLRTLLESIPLTPNKDKHAPQ